MIRRPTLRLFLETALGAASVLVSLTTLAMPDWIERAFRVEPDGGQGWTECGWAIALGVAALVFFADAHRLGTRGSESDSRH